MSLKTKLKIEAENSYFNIHFNDVLFYYSSAHDTEYFDFGGLDCKDEKYTNLIRRMNKYFLRKKYNYDDEIDN